MSRHESRYRGLAIVVALVGILVLLTFTVGKSSSSLERTTIQALVLLLATVGYYSFVGTSGVFSFGHIAFMSIGAYTTAIVSLTGEEKSFLLPELPGALATISVSPYVACLFGAVVAAAVAALLAIPIMRLVGMTAALTTFAVLQIVNVVEVNLHTVTNGQQGIAGIPSVATIPVVLATVAGAIVAVAAFQQSRWGRRLVATREDEPAARSVGIGVHAERRIAFVLSAFIVGLSGGLYAQFLEVVTPSTFFLSTTFLVVAMLVVGGVSSLSGAVVGSVTVSAVSEFLLRVEGGINLGGAVVDGPTGIQEVGLALIMLGILLLRPKGLMGGRELTFLQGAFRRLGRRTSLSTAGGARTNNENGESI